MREEQSESPSGEPVGVSMAHILELPDELQTIVTWLMRQGEAALSEVATFIQRDEAITNTLLADLAVQGFVQCLQQRWRLELERFGQFLHDIRLPFSLELAQLGQHRRVKDRSHLHLALSIQDWGSNLNKPLKRLCSLFRPQPDAF